MLTRLMIAITKPMLQPMVTCGEVWLRCAGDVVTRLCKLGAEKKREKIGLVRQRMCGSCLVYCLSHRRLSLYSICIWFFFEFHMIWYVNQETMWVCIDR